MSRRTPNPYRPGFNQAPARLVGRDAILAAAAEALEIAAFDGRTPRPLLLVGPRGVGKTVLLGEIATVAAQGTAGPPSRSRSVPAPPSPLSWSNGCGMRPPCSDRRRWRRADGCGCPVAR
ncbi:AAA family ATPase [Ornithinimicrobium sp. LYQ121]|uniref:AAA family ATPase n=1 Tax=Ornithinimicrobium sp. LYQ121 TaxID=3378801 RepID=UPI0038524A21